MVMEISATLWNISTGVHHLLAAGARWVANALNAAVYLYIRRDATSVMGAVILNAVRELVDSSIGLPTTVNLRLKWQEF